MSLNYNDSNKSMATVSFYKGYLNHIWDIRSINTTPHITDKHNYFYNKDNLIIHDENNRNLDFLIDREQSHSEVISIEYKYNDSIDHTDYKILTVNENSCIFHLPFYGNTMYIKNSLICNSSVFFNSLIYEHYGSHIIVNDISVNSINFKVPLQLEGFSINELTTNNVYMHNMLTESILHENDLYIDVNTFLNSISLYGDTVKAQKELRINDLYSKYAYASNITTYTVNANDVAIEGLSCSNISIGTSQFHVNIQDNEGVTFIDNSIVVLNSNILIYDNDININIHTHLNECHLDNAIYNSYVFINNCAFLNTVICANDMSIYGHAYLDTDLNLRDMNFGTLRLHNLTLSSILQKNSRSTINYESYYIHGIVNIGEISTNYSLTCDVLQLSSLSQIDTANVQNMQIINNSLGSSLHVSNSDTYLPSTKFNNDGFINSIFIEIESSIIFNSYYIKVDNSGLDISVSNGYNKVNVQANSLIISHNNILLGSNAIVKSNLNMNNLHTDSKLEAPRIQVFNNIDQTSSGTVTIHGNTLLCNHNSVMITLNSQIQMQNECLFNSYITVYGQTELNSCQINGDVYIDGDCTFQSLNCTSLMINNCVTFNSHLTRTLLLNDCILNSMCVIRNLYAHSSVTLNSISIYGDVYVDSIKANRNISVNANIQCSALNHKLDFISLYHDDTYINATQLFNFDDSMFISQSNILIQNSLITANSGLSVGGNVYATNMFVSDVKCFASYSQNSNGDTTLDDNTLTSMSMNISNDTAIIPNLNVNNLHALVDVNLYHNNMVVDGKIDINSQCNMYNVLVNNDLHIHGALLLNSFYDNVVDNSIMNIQFHDNVLKFNNNVNVGIYVSNSNSDTPAFMYNCHQSTWYAHNTDIVVNKESKLFFHKWNISFDESNNLMFSYNNVSRMKLLNTI